MTRRKKADQIVLTPDLIKKQNAQYDRKREVDIKDGKWTRIYIKFKPEKIEELLVDFWNFVADREKHTENPLTELLILKYIYLFICVYFSDLVKEMPTNI